MRVQQIKMILQGMNLMNLILCLQDAKKIKTLCINNIIINKQP